MAANTSREVIYAWEGTDKKGKKLKGEMKASGEAFVNATLRRQGVTVQKIKKQSSLKRGGSVSDKDVSLFTRQLATMKTNPLLILALGAVLATAARAHDTWLQTNTAISRSGDAVYVDFLLGKAAW